MRPSGALSPAFADLLPFKVHEVLFVLSDYDSFILAEDGQLDHRVISGFLEMDIRALPRVTQVSSGAAALARLASQPGRFQLVVASPDLGDMGFPAFARELKQRHPSLAVTLFGYDTRTVAGVRERLGGEPAGFEKPFVWQGDVGIFLAIVKEVEDRRNAANDTGRYGVPAILLIEDSIRYYSSFLPVAYQAVFEQTRNLLPEGLSLTEKVHRIRRRPKILLCDRYEEAWDSFTAYPDGILGVISDVDFPRGGVRARHAGERFVAEMRRRRPDIPAILHSRRSENRERAHRVGADFLLKGSRDLLRQIRELMRSRFHFGDFVFRAPDGEEIARAPDLESFVRLVPGIPRESLEHHGRSNEISHWLMARGELSVARRFRELRAEDFGPGPAMGREIAAALVAHRRQRSRAVVGDFHREGYEPGAGLFRIGGGSVGGKARGLAFSNSVLARSDIAARHPDTRIAVPDAVVLATGVFDEFLEQNDLLPFALEARDEADLHDRFQRATFPEAAVEDLSRFVEAVRHPLAVRSSSLLEDSPYQPFSGVYETLLIANRTPSVRARLRALVRAVKWVYASLFRPGVRDFFDVTPYRLEEEKMAVILQRVVGRPHGTRFYPDIAGTARSHNFYATPPLKPDDGIAAVGLGLGEAITSGGSSVRFSPRHPRRRPGYSTAAEALRNTQREFLALDLDPPSGERGGAAPLLELPLKAAETDGVLPYLASTVAPGSDALRDGTSRPGARVVTLAPLLNAPDRFPLAAILDDLLAIGKEACRAPVEVEFAANLSGGPNARPDFGFLQLKRLPRSDDAPGDEEEIPEDAHVLCHSARVLGNGRIRDLHDLVVVDREAFDRLRSRESALEVARLNGRLVREERPYLLIGVGRWGSRDRFLGIPVTWDQVNGARAIVEAGFRDLVVTPSQGTHFFENLIVNGAGYFTVNPERGEGSLDWAWLLSRPAVSERNAVRHIRLSNPVSVHMRGGCSDGWILGPEKDPGDR